MLRYTAGKLCSMQLDLGLMQRTLREQLTIDTPDRKVQSGCY